MTSTPPSADVALSALAAAQPQEAVAWRLTGESVLIRHGEGLSRVQRVLTDDEDIFLSAPAAGPEWTKFDELLAQIESNPADKQLLDDARKWVRATFYAGRAEQGGKS